MKPGCRQVYWMRGSNWGYSGIVLNNNNNNNNTNNHINRTSKKKLHNYKTKHKKEKTQFGNSTQPDPDKQNKIKTYI